MRFKTKWGRLCEMVLPYSPDGLEAHAAGLELAPAAASGWRLGLQPADAGQLGLRPPNGAFSRNAKCPFPFGNAGGVCTTLDALLWNHNQSERYISITPHNYAETDFLRGVNINFRGGHALN